MPSLDFDLDINASGEVELHQCVNSLRGRIHDIKQALVCADFELVARLFVDVWTTQKVNFSILFGSGIGPRTDAPVRFAVLTISAVEASSTR